MRLLVVMGTPADGRRWATALRRGGFAVDGARTIADAVRARDEVDYDALLVAHSLRDGDGSGLARAAATDTAVVVLSGPEATGSVVASLLAGGVDDVVVPPVGGREMVLRVAKALVRRTGPASGRVELGSVVVDRSTRVATRDGVPLALTPTELCVLDHLAAHVDRVVPAGELLDHCWDSRRDLFADPLPSQLTRLRRALRGAVTIRWVDRGGYLLEPDAAAEPRSAVGGDGHRASGM